MISPTRFKKLQELFFNKVTKCCNPAIVTFNFMTVTSTGSFTDFTGDSDRSVKEAIKLRCFYTRNIGERIRENTGVDDDTSTIVYISPLELKNKFGKDTFPDYVTKSFSQIEVSFLDKSFDIVKIVPLEPMHNGGSYTCLAYQIELKD